MAEDETTKLLAEMKYLEGIIEKHTRENQTCAPRHGFKRPAPAPHVSQHKLSAVKTATNKYKLDNRERPQVSAGYSASPVKKSRYKVDKRLPVTSLSRASSSSSVHDGEVVQSSLTQIEESLTPVQTVRTVSRYKVTKICVSGASPRNRKMSPNNTMREKLVKKALMHKHGFGSEFYYNNSSAWKRSAFARQRHMLRNGRFRTNTRGRKRRDSSKLVLKNGETYHVSSKKIRKAPEQSLLQNNTSTGSAFSTVMVRGVAYTLGRGAHRHNTPKSKPKHTGPLRGHPHDHIQLHVPRTTQCKPEGACTCCGSMLAPRHAVNRSLVVVRGSHKKTRMERRYCMFFNRFGRCNRGEKCPYIHDRTKIAVCTRFLRGTCHVDDCQFSHVVAPEKMPMCRFFSRGTCSRDPCPYSHVYVPRGAQFCPDFARGYCAKGDKCKKKHLIYCPDVTDTGTCVRGKTCPLRHRKAVGKTLKSEETLVKAERVREVTEGGASAQQPGTDLSVPFGQRVLPQYISLNTGAGDSEDAPAVPQRPPKSSSGQGLLTRPRLQRNKPSQL